MEFKLGRKCCCMAPQAWADPAASHSLNKTATGLHGSSHTCGSNYWLQLPSDARLCSSVGWHQSNHQSCAFSMHFALFPGFHRQSGSMYVKRVCILGVRVTRWSMRYMEHAREVACQHHFNSVQTHQPVPYASPGRQCFTRHHMQSGHGVCSLLPALTIERRFAVGTHLRNAVGSHLQNNCRRKKRSRHLPVCPARHALETQHGSPDWRCGLKLMQLQLTSASKRVFNRDGVEQSAGCGTCSATAAPAPVLPLHDCLQMKKMLRTE